MFAGSLSDIIFIALLGFHIAGVISWMGASVLYGSVLGPSFSKSDLVESKPEFAISLMSKLSRFITGASILTMIAGFFLFDYISTVATYILPPGSRILFIYAGATLGFAAFVVTLAAVIPSTNRIVKILKSGVLSEATAGSTNQDPVNSKRVQIRHSLRAIRSGLSASAALLLLIFVLMILGTNL